MDNKTFVDHDEKIISVPATMSREEVLSNQEYKRLFEKENYTLQFNLL